MTTGESGRGPAVMAQVRRRFLPFAFLCYVVAYVDRVNVGFVATTLQRELGFGATEYGIAAGLFFLGYALELECVRRSIEYARSALGLGA